MKLEPIPKERRAAFEQMFQLYLHDMSEFMGWPLSPDGCFEVPEGLLDPYWVRSDHWPYFIVQNKQIIGFSLVRCAPDNPSVFDMGQFFIIRAFRRSDCSVHAFQLSLKAHPGSWQVRVLPDNTPAVRFWRRATGMAAEDGWSEHIDRYGEQDMIFFRFQR
ncbi:Predicted acetyltransferase [Aliiroseovarius crassostreae]|uniref:N-acetyltransferase domain-containing protein n=1 Tax=Aliiroseovarius crassostreae TaxID=154981 RepID=A0A0N8IBY0_9RHOB|nr:hypothetical protein [Aliiroseovarius crassostreae]KPN64363.1 hypothetical protein AKJ29_17225 [Aliiroseovarius crassostreae]SFU33353.1 Predicted acetyltransferase [Aliiroseovarius crassostreae]